MGIVLVGHDAGGTIPPMLAVASALADRGADVTVLSQPSVEARATAAGCGFVAFSEVGDYDRRRTLEDQLERTLPALVGASTGDDLQRLADAHRPDVVVVDANLAGALAASEAMTDVPSVVLLHSMYRTYVDLWLGEIWPVLADLVNETRAAFGLDAVGGWGDQFARHAGSLSVVTPSFEAPVDPPLRNLRHFGFLVPPASRDGTHRAVSVPGGNEPLALVSLSTTMQEQERTLASIVDAARPHARLLVTTSGYGSVASATDVTVLESGPHPLVLPAVDLVICHAGLGTISAALAFGVPLVSLPGGRDQPLNTERVEALGVGIDGSKDVSGAVELVLGDGSFRKAAEQQANESRAAGGPTAAAEWLLDLSSS